MGGNVDEQTRVIRVMNASDEHRIMFISQPRIDSNVYICIHTAKIFKLQVKVQCKFEHH